MSLTKNIQTLLPEALSKEILANFEKQKITIVWSEPGIGRTTMLMNLAIVTGYEVVEFRVPQMVKGDFSGICGFEPSFAKEVKEAHAAGKKVAFVFDEVHSASVGAADIFAKAVLNRQIGSVTLAEHDVILATGLVSNEGVPNLGLLSPETLNQVVNVILTRKAAEVVTQ